MTSTRKPAEALDSERWEVWVVTVARDKCARGETGTRGPSWVCFAVWRWARDG